jgi:YesN/AraC family two-component response regulator
MPGMDGIALVKEINKLFPDNNPPYILMLPALEKNIYQHEAVKAGITKFLSKPVKMHELYAILLSLFDGNLQNDGNHLSHPGEHRGKDIRANQHHGRR